MPQENWNSRQSLAASLTIEDDSHLILLVENEQGYKNLSYLLTQARMQKARGKPRVSYKHLEERCCGTGSAFRLSKWAVFRLPYF